MLMWAHEYNDLENMPTYTLDITGGLQVSMAIPPVACGHQNYNPEMSIVRREKNGLSIVTSSTHSMVDAATNDLPYSKPQTLTTCGFTALKICMEDMAICHQFATWNLMYPTTASNFTLCKCHIHSSALCRK
jgi:hypothetical protein